MRRLPSVMPDQVEDLGVAREPDLDHLGQPRDEVVVRKRLEHVQVAHHAGGFVEAADQVLSVSAVH